MVGQVDWCRYVADLRPTSVVGVMHYAGEDDGVEDYRMMSLDFSPRGKPGTGPTAQISCGRYIPAGWHEAIAYRPLAALQVSCAEGIAFVDLPTTLVWFDEAGRHQESLESERPVGEQLLTQFFRAVTSLVRRTCDLEDACLALRSFKPPGGATKKGGGWNFERASGVIPPASATHPAQLAVRSGRASMIRAMSARSFWRLLFRRVSSVAAQTFP